jgi:hypothetical protein
VQFIIDFLTSPWWQGIQGLLAVMGLVLAFNGPRGWVEQHARAPWVSRVPWILVFVVGGAAAGLSVGLKFRDVYRGASFALATLCVGLVIKLANATRSFKRASSESAEALLTTEQKLAEKTEHHTRLLDVMRRIVNLQQYDPTDCKTFDWKMIHSISDDGGGRLYEELTLIPTGQQRVYFYFIKHTFEPDDGTHPPITISASSLTYNKSLAVVEIDRSASDARCVVVLDPPSTPKEHHRIAIECQRPGIWGKLVKQDEDDGYFRSSYETNLLRLEFIAPPGKKWTQFNPGPGTGTFNIETTTHSRIIWTIDNPPIKLYNYVLRWE